MLLPCGLELTASVSRALRGGRGKEEPASGAGCRSAAPAKISLSQAQLRPPRGVFWPSIEFIQLSSRKDHSSFFMQLLIKETSPRTGIKVTVTGAARVRPRKVHRRRPRVDCSSPKYVVRPEQRIRSHTDVRHGCLGAHPENPAAATQPRRPRRTPKHSVSLTATPPPHSLRRRRLSRWSRR